MTPLFLYVVLQVGGRDTLTSVAARFDTTPSELTSINKLNSSFIYPGQQLLVPDKAAAAAAAASDANEDGGDGASSSPSGKSSPTEDKARKISTDDSEQDSKEKGKNRGHIYQSSSKMSFVHCYCIAPFSKFHHNKIIIGWVETNRRMYGMRC